MYIKSNLVSSGNKGKRSNNPVIIKNDLNLLNIIITRWTHSDILQFKKIFSLKYIHCIYIYNVQEIFSL